MLITKQLCYISKLMRGLFLSLAACKYMNRWEQHRQV